MVGVIIAVEKHTKQENWTYQFLRLLFGKYSNVWKRLLPKVYEVMNIFIFIMPSMSGETKSLSWCREVKSIQSIQIDLLEMESFDLLSANNFFLPFSSKEKMGVKGLASSHICSNQLHDYKTGRPWWNPTSSTKAQETCTPQSVCSFSWTIIAIVESSQKELIMCWHIHLMPCILLYPVIMYHL